MHSVDYWRTDTSLKLLNLLFTSASCGLSAYAGWLLAHDLGALIQLTTAVTFGGIAYGLSSAAIWRTQYRLARDREGYSRTSRLCLFLLAANLVTDYSASTTLRDQSIVHTQNKNTVASMAQSEVQRIEKAMADLRAETAWRTKYEAPATYDALISQQKQIVDRGANVWQRTKQCSDTTLEVSSRVCSEIKRLEAQKANAERRQVILSELKILGEQLAQAKQEAANAPRQGNPALAPIIGLVTMATQSLQTSDGEIKWGLNYYVMLFTIVMSAAIWYLSTEIGHRAGPMPAPEPAPRRHRTNYWLEPPEAPPAPPIPLHAEPSPPSDPGGTSARGRDGSSTVHVTSYTTKSRAHDHEALQRLMRELEEDFGLEPKH